MERLTGRNSDGGAFYKNCFREDTCAGIGCSEKCDHCKHSYNACEKLAVYEDAEEQGLLIWLPVAVGSTVYHVIRDDVVNPPVYISEHEIIDVSAKAIYFADDWWTLEELDEMNAFLTREEAEAALAEMEGGEDFEFC